MSCIYVLDALGKPLMPTRRKGHVKRLLNTGKARIASHVPFVIQLMYQTQGVTQPLYGGVDPGRTNVGLAVLDTKGNVVYRAHVTTRNKEIAKWMEKRRQHRQASRAGERKRRQRRAIKYHTVQIGTTWYRVIPGCQKPVPCKYIRNTEARFRNRRRPEGWLTPTARQLVQTHTSAIHQACKLLPVTDFALELNKFAFMLLENGSVVGSDFQNGRLKGYASVKDYVYARQNGSCACCKKQKIEQYHHVKPKSESGSNLPENLIGLCKKCHESVHTGKKTINPKGFAKKYQALSILNQAIPSIAKEMRNIFGGKHAHFCTGKETARVRESFALPKDHSMDAVCIAALSGNIHAVKGPGPEYEMRQFRRHDRTRIHCQHQRTYQTAKGKKSNGSDKYVTIAKNRKPAFKQKGSALSDWYTELCRTEGKRKAQIARSRLKAVTSKRSYNRLDRVLPGAILLYQKQRYVLRGQKNNGTLFLVIGRDNRFCIPADKCRILRKNTGLVYIY